MFLALGVKRLKKKLLPLNAYVSKPPLRKHCKRLSYRIKVEEKGLPW